MKYSAAGQSESDLLGPLTTYSRDEVWLWNWFCRAFPDVEEWRDWLNETFSKTLARRAGYELTLTQTSRTMTTGIDHTFNKPEVSIGRSSENDLQLAGASISKSHARVVLHNDNYFFEDLGGALGSFINQKKMVPHEPSLLRSGDQIVIFPYTLTVRARPIYAAESDIQLHAETVDACSWGEFGEDTPLGYDTFWITAHPAEASVCVQIDEAFVKAILERSLFPIGVSQKISEEGGLGILQLLLLSVLRNLNDRLAFPYQFSLSPDARHKILPNAERGTVVKVSVKLTDTSVGGRIFLPYDFFLRMSKTASVPTSIRLPETVKWPFPIAAGKVTLTVDDLRHLEREDVVVFDRVPEMLYPKDFNRGWNIELNQEDRWTANLEQYFERKPFMAAPLDSPEAGRQETFNLGQLPILLHVIVAEKELTLDEANALAPGSILQLDRDRSSAVRLAVNGRTIGEGELVEIDGKLGVKIGKWGAP